MDNMRAEEFSPCTTLFGAGLDFAQKREKKSAWKKEEMPKMWEYTVYIIEKNPVNMFLKDTYKFHTRETNFNQF